MKVQQFKNERGVPVKNQFIIEFDDRTAFQSYNSIIAIKNIAFNVPTMLDATYWDYSRTTGKYRNLFLGETKAETEKKIKKGEYILTDLNNPEKQKQHTGHNDCIVCGMPQIGVHYHEQGE